MVRDHAPTLRGAHVDIGGHHIGHGITFGCVQFNAFHQVVQGAGEGLDFAHMLWVCRDDTVGEHGFKRASDAVCAQQARAAGVHTNDVFFVSPTAHEAFYIAGTQGFVKGCFNLIGCAADGGCLKLGLGQLFRAAEFTQSSQLSSKHKQLGLGSGYVDLGLGVLEVLFGGFFGGIGTLFIQIGAAHSGV